MPDATDPPPYDETDPLSDKVRDHSALINHNGIMLNALIELLVDKGFITQEEFRIYRLRELADFDRVQARLWADWEARTKGRDSPGSN